MHIIVSIKQVPGSNEVKIDPETYTLMRSGVEAVINPFDTYAIEEAVRIKERLADDSKVTVITMGPPQAEEALREAISLGCDDGILVSDRAFAGSDTLATSYTLAKAIEKIGDFGLILCGKQAMDGDTAQVGPGIAEKLRIPFITFVSKIEELEQRKIKVQRLLEEDHEVIVSRLPALITVVKEINEPRIASLKGRMRAKKAELKTWGAADLDTMDSRIGLTGSPTKVIKVFSPEQRGRGEMVEGELPEQVKKLQGIIQGLNIIK